MHNTIDMLGRRFGDLEVLRQAPTVTLPDGGKSAAWLCRCACGREVVFRGGLLRRGRLKACGIGHKYRHPLNALAKEERQIFNAMLQRCYNKKDTNYKNYGKRGIKVCMQWKNDFTQFLSDMRARPGSEYSIDRINNDGNYEPGNCRWATKKEQARNTRSNVRMLLDTRLLTIPEFCEESGINASTIRKRLRRGWSIEAALTTPAKDMTEPRNKYPADWLDGSAFKKPS